MSSQLVLFHKNSPYQSANHFRYHVPGIMLTSFAPPGWGRNKKSTHDKWIFYLMSPVAGHGVEPCLGDYEPPVRPYTTPRVNTHPVYHN